MELLPSPPNPIYLLLKSNKLGRGQWEDWGAKENNIQALIPPCGVDHIYSNSLVIFVYGIMLVPEGRNKETLASTSKRVVSQSVFNLEANHIFGFLEISELVFRKLSYSV